MTKQIEELLGYFLELFFGLIQEFGLLTTLLIFAGYIAFVGLFMWAIGAFASSMTVYPPGVSPILSDDEYQRLLEERLAREKGKVQEEQKPDLARREETYCPAS